MAHLEEGQIRVEEEAGLAGAADDQIEVVEPVVAEQEGAHDLGVVEEGVRQQKDLGAAARDRCRVLRDVGGRGEGCLWGRAARLLATETELSEHVGEVGRALDILARVHRHRVLDLAVAMAQVDGAAHVLVHFSVALRQQIWLAILQVDELAEEAHVDDEKLGVHRREVGRREGHQLLVSRVVSSLALRRRHESRYKY